MSGEDNGEQLHVSVADFATVEDVARRIKESGGTLSLATAMDPRDDDAMADGDNAQQLSIANETIERVKKLQKALSFLQRDASSLYALARRNAAHVQNRHGVGRLPDEVFSRIFGFYFRQYDDMEEHAKELNIVASVCMRFRLIVLTMSRYWGCISSNMHPKLVDMHLNRSGNHPLAIVDEWNPSKNNIAGRALFFAKILPTIHRWESLSLKYMDCEESIMRTFTNELSKVCLPRLRTLKMVFPTVVELEREDEEEETVDRKFHIYNSWISPSLRELIVKNTIPRVTRNHQFQLTSCTIENSLFAWCKPYDALGTLMSFLNAQPSLEEFSLDTISFPEDTDYPEWKRVTLPALKKLALNIHYEVWDYTNDDGALDDQTNLFAPRILSHLVTPALERLSADFILSLDVADTFEFSDVFPEFNAYMHLETLKLCIFQTEDFDFQLSPFLEIFRRMPSLKHLHLMIPESEVLGAVASSSNDALVRPPPLRTLHLDECRNLSEDCLSKVIEFLSRGDSWSEFEELKVTKCPKLQECSAAFSKWLGPGKVKIMRDDKDGD